MDGELRYGRPRSMEEHARALLLRALSQLPKNTPLAKEIKTFLSGGQE